MERGLQLFVQHIPPRSAGAFLCHQRQLKINPERVVTRGSVQDPSYGRAYLLHLSQTRGLN